MLSFRLGGTDGVSVEAGKWEWALRELGFSVRRVAGELGDGRADDTLLPWLAIGARDDAADPDALAAALTGADLVVVENLCSLPLNLAAARATADALARHRRRVAFHHHDLPWQRPDLAHIDGFPPDLPDALHVTINERSRTELADRGIAAVTLHNRFDFDGPEGDRAATRRQFGFADPDVVLLQPTRAIRRKNVGGGLAFAEALAPLLGRARALRYWRTGAVEDGYEDELGRLEAATSIDIRHGRTDRTADAYAAADVVLFPSTWEGFGNPVIESVVARRPLVVGGYPVLDEITACGLRFFALDAPGTLADWLRAPDPDDPRGEPAAGAGPLRPRRPAARAGRGVPEPRMDDMVNEPDPVLARRARIARIVSQARRVGYLALLVSMVSFVIALVTDFPSLWVNLSIAALRRGVPDPPRADRARVRRPRGRTGGPRAAVASAPDHVAQHQGDHHAESRHLHRRRRTDRGRRRRAGRTARR